MFDGITYHHQSIALYEYCGDPMSCVSAEFEASQRPSYRVITDDWTRDCDDEIELKQAVSDARLCELDYTIEILPF